MSAATDLLEVLCLTEAVPLIFMANILSPEIIGSLLPQSRHLNHWPLIIIIVS
jgi:hypothetical protein